jgi:hypothetical protein
VERLAGIKTAGTDLESTCVYFAFGLDLYASQVLPSKSFDVLNADFDYVTLVASILTLLVGVVFMARVSARHVLDGLWA